MVRFEAERKRWGVYGYGVGVTFSFKLLPLVLNVKDWHRNYKTFGAGQNCFFVFTDFHLSLRSNLQETEAVDHIFISNILAL